MGSITNFKPINIDQFLSIGGLLGAIQGHSTATPISIPGITTTVPGQLSTGIDLAQLLGLASIGNPGTLIALLPQFSQVIAGNAQGANGQSLLSIVMMAIGQQYVAINAPTP